MFLRLTISMLLIGSTNFARAQDGQRKLFDFSRSADRQWQIVNDGVMGGLSRSNVAFTADQTMRFTGTLSLANNGGFASVRSQPGNLGLRPGDTLVLLVKGDGRRYTLNLYVPDRRTAYSYRTEFATVSGGWTEVRAPLDSFVATSFGQIVRGAGPVDPASVTSIGILLGDKRQGPFELEVASIKVESTGGQ